MYLAFFRKVMLYGERCISADESLGSHENQAHLFTTISSNIVLRNPVFKEIEGLPPASRGRIRTPTNKYLATSSQKLPASRHRHSTLRLSVQAEVLQSLNIHTCHSLKPPSSGRPMSFLAEVFLLLVFYTVTRYFANDGMNHTGNRVPLRYRGRGGRRTVLPSYPQHNEAETTSKISGSVDSDDTEDTDVPDDTQHKEFYPSLEDVSEVRNILRRLWSSSSKSSSRRNVMLPDEVIDIILDEAEYWPSMVTKLDTTPFVISADGDRECLKTPPLCYSLAKEGKKSQEEASPTGQESSPRILLHRGIHPCRKIVFDISSHDQGWGGESAHRGTFTGSWTWFDAYIRPSTPKDDADDGRKASDTTTATTTRSADSDSSSEGTPSSHLRPFLPEPTKLQCNRTATINSTDYHIFWHYRDNLPADSPEAERIERETGRGRATLDGNAVRNMKVGDEVSVWLRARFAGWRNHVDKMSVRVFWAA
ncbi:conserved hypothetical protein [Talaromyces stipitatus ATCC 10500]|uniref:Uncharacterized protein n=1 Tax=Talaromyces stipitatus (strain ATCC 10500 / CBS 375.48 / QM 6759 / NRRL 1006) TaxID=441959 RepID=B8MDY5_TALSN|nr:uncharacterized protein TSTA_011710 [Talaromyces stipitatus ATCC 10500]EED16062.1 conserved hypothetical protein [Talaromyces stipitatus ATCC 10500]